MHLWGRNGRKCICRVYSSTCIHTRWHLRAFGAGFPVGCTSPASTSIPFSSLWRVSKIMSCSPEAELPQSASVKRSNLRVTQAIALSLHAAHWWATALHSQRPMGPFLTPQPSRTTSSYLLLSQAVKRHSSDQKLDLKLLFRWVIEYRNVQSSLQRYKTPLWAENRCAYILASVYLAWNVMVTFCRQVNSMAFGI